MMDRAHVAKRRLGRDWSQMAMPVAQLPAANRMLGNTDAMAAHDLHNESPYCRVDEIITAGDAVVFSPDRLKQAYIEGFDGCYYCIGDPHALLSSDILERGPPGGPRSVREGASGPGNRSTTRY